MAGFENDIGFSKNFDFTQADNQAPTEANGLATNGQLWIGTTSVNAGGTHINVGSLTSPNGSVTFGYSSPNITLQVTGGTTSVITLTGNSGVATPVSGNINVVTSNTTVKFVGSGSTVTENFGLTNLLMGSAGMGITSATLNVGVGLSALGAVTAGAANVAVGNSALALLTSSQSNVCVGRSAGASIVAAGDGNTLVGDQAGAVLTTGTNTLIGSGCGLNVTTGTGNTCMGNTCYGSGLTGVRNIIIGTSAGSAYTTSESSNILIGNTGVIGESNVIRLGVQGTGTAQQSQTYIAGVVNTVSGRVVKVTTPGAYPYTTLTTDYLILVDSSSARTIVPLASPVNGTTYRIKDNVGTAAANNITITPSGKNIENAASFIINTNGGSVDICYQGTQWVVL